MKRVFVFRLMVVILRKLIGNEMSALDGFCVGQSPLPRTWLLTVSGGRIEARNYNQALFRFAQP